MYMIAKKENPTIQDVLDTVNNFANYVEGRFNKIDERFNKIETTMTTFVTKDYLDDKLADLRGDLVVMIRKEDNKLTNLISILTTKQILSRAEQQKLVSLEPFAQ